MSKSFKPKFFRSILASIILFKTAFFLRISGETNLSKRFLAEFDADANASATGLLLPTTALNAALPSSFNCFLIMLSCLGVIKRASSETFLPINSTGIMRFPEPRFPTIGISFPTFLVTCSTLLSKVVCLIALTPRTDFPCIPGIFIKKESKTSSLASLLTFAVPRSTTDCLRSLILLSAD